MTSDESYSALVDALVDVNLVDLLETPGPFTILAPTNEAFAAIGGTESLTDGELRNILLYHVIRGEFDESLIRSLGAAESANGLELQVNRVGEDLFINDSKVIETDIIANNGIIHRIDAVLDPPARQCRYFDFICRFLDRFI